MSSAPAKLACPLCGTYDTVPIRRIATEPITGYWKTLGYDVKAAFPDFPATIEKLQCLVCDLRFFSPQLIGEPALYRALGGTRSYYDAAKWEFIEVLKLLAARPRGGALLEYGCGHGAFLRHAAPLFDRAVGVDFNTDAVTQGKASGLNIVDTDLSQIGERFDVIACFQILEHVPSPAETLRQLARLLQPGGLLIVAVPNEDSLLGQLDYNFLNLPPHHASCWTDKALAYVERLLPLNRETYLCEPLGLDLYLGALHQRLDRTLSSRNVLMRACFSLVRRTAIAFAMTNFDAVRTGAPGHTHIAVFRG